MNGGHQSTNLVQKNNHHSWRMIGKRQPMDFKDNHEEDHVNFVHVHDKAIGLKFVVCIHFRYVHVQYLSMDLANPN